MEIISVIKAGFVSQRTYIPCYSILFTEDLLPPGFPNIDMGPQLKVVERTRTATMLCAASGNPDPEITWYKDFLPIDPSASNGRIKQLRSGKKSPSIMLFVFFPLINFSTCFISQDILEIVNMVVFVLCVAQSFFTQKCVR